MKLQILFLLFTAIFIMNYKGSAYSEEAYDYNHRIKDYTIIYNNTLMVNEDKVAVCHKGQTIFVSRSALKAHLKHGDKLGGCP